MFYKYELHWMVHKPLVRNGLCLSLRKWMQLNYSPDSPFFAPHSLAIYSFAIVRRDKCAAITVMSAALHHDV